MSCSIVLFCLLAVLCACVFVCGLFEQHGNTTQTTVFVLLFLFAVCRCVLFVCDSFSCFASCPLFVCVVVPLFVRCLFVAFFVAVVFWGEHTADRVLLSFVLLFVVCFVCAFVLLF